MARRPAGRAPDQVPHNWAERMQARTGHVCLAPLRGAATSQGASELASLRTILALGGVYVADNLGAAKGRLPDAAMGKRMEQCVDGL